MKKLEITVLLSSIIWIVLWFYQLNFKPTGILVSKTEANLINVLCYIVPAILTYLAYVYFIKKRIKDNVGLLLCIYAPALNLVCILVLLVIFVKISSYQKVRSLETIAMNCFVISDMEKCYYYIKNNSILEKIDSENLTNIYKILDSNFDEELKALRFEKLRKDNDKMENIRNLKRDLSASINQNNFKKANKIIQEMYRYFPKYEPDWF